MLDHSYMSKCHIRAWGICAAAFLTTTVLASGTATAATSYAATTRQSMGSAVNLVIYNGDPPASQYFNNINAVFEKAAGSDQRKQACDKRLPIVKEPPGSRVLARHRHVVNLEIVVWLTL